MEAQIKSCVIQADRSILLEVDIPGSDLARQSLAAFAELEKSPEHVHTYRLSPLSLWNAAAAGIKAEQVILQLRAHARYGVPEVIEADIRDIMGRYGALRLVKGGSNDGDLILEVDDVYLREEIARAQGTKPVVRREGNVFHVDALQRGTVKQRLARMGYPVDDQAGFVEGEPLAIELRSTTRQGQAFALRDYQREAVELFVDAGRGHGVMVLPCGSGKTVVGLGIMERLRCTTLILCPNITAARQWISEILDKTHLSADQVGEYSGQKKQIRDVTVATYQIVSRRQGTQLAHRDLFTARSWGTLIYDEVHLLPAPMFRVAAEIQARRRVGLTATLIREDGLETDVFALIGPKRFDVPWKNMEKRGFIARACCYEVRVGMSDACKMAHAVAETPQEKYRVAAENSRKDDVVRALIAKHCGERILVIGHYVKQLQKLSKQLRAPLITGDTPQVERDRLFAGLREGAFDVLVVSKVANFAVDLPDASVCIQVSGTFGSRQEEAQRLGRILRPKAEQRDACFYTVVSRGSSEMRFALNRQMFLAEQGYSYAVEDWQLAPRDALLWEGP